MRFLFALVLFIASTIHAQSCPQKAPDGSTRPSSPVTLEGKLIFHDGVRRWMELKVSTPTCGESSIELFSEKIFRSGPGADSVKQSIESLRGCDVKTHGTLDSGGTGYYSTNIFQSVASIEPLPGCMHRAPLPNYSGNKPDPVVRTYRVDMQIDYSPHEAPVTAIVHSGSRVLHPWQAYASYFLTGGSVFYGYCARGFTVTSVSGTPEGNPRNIEAATFDPESAAEKHILHQQLSYTCKRKDH